MSAIDDLAWIFIQFQEGNLRGDDLQEAIRRLATTQEDIDNEYVDIHRRGTAALREISQAFIKDALRPAYREQQHDHRFPLYLGLDEEDHIVQYLLAPGNSRLSLRSCIGSIKPKPSIIRRTINQLHGVRIDDRVRRTDIIRSPLSPHGFFRTLDDLLAEGGLAREQHQWLEDAFKPYARSRNPEVADAYRAAFDPFMRRGAGAFTGTHHRRFLDLYRQTYHPLDWAAVRAFIKELPDKLASCGFELLPLGPPHFALERSDGQELLYTAMLRKVRQVNEGINLYNLFLHGRSAAAAQEIVRNLRSIDHAITKHPSKFDEVVSRNEMVAYRHGDLVMVTIAEQLYNSFFEDASTIANTAFFRREYLQPSSRKSAASGLTRRLVRTELSPIDLGGELRVLQDPSLNSDESLLSRFAEIMGGRFAGTPVLWKEYFGPTAKDNGYEAIHWIAERDGLYMDGHGHAPLSRHEEKRGMARHESYSSEEVRETLRRLEKDEIRGDLGRLAKRTVTTRNAGAAIDLIERLSQKAGDRFAWENLSATYPALMQGTTMLSEAVDLLCSWATAAPKSGRENYISQMLVSIYYPRQRYFIAQMLDGIQQGVELPRQQLESLAAASATVRRYAGKRTAREFIAVTAGESSCLIQNYLTHARFDFKERHATCKALSETLNDASIPVDLSDHQVQRLAEAYVISSLDRILDADPEEIPAWYAQLLEIQVPDAIAEKRQDLPWTYLQHRPLEARQRLPIARDLAEMVNTDSATISASVDSVYLRGLFDLYKEFFGRFGMPRSTPYLLVQAGLLSRINERANWPRQECDDLDDEAGHASPGDIDESEFTVPLLQEVGQYHTDQLARGKLLSRRMADGSSRIIPHGIKTTMPTHQFQNRWNGEIEPRLRGYGVFDEDREAIYQNVLSLLTALKGR
ncbi:MAG: hypothetical protein V1735_03770 [Nanoarchaeota archaeon]